MYAFIGVRGRGGEVCKFKFKVGGGLECFLQIARGGSKLSSRFGVFVVGVFYKE